MKKIFVIILAINFFAFKGIAQVQRESNPSQNVATTSDKKSEKREMMRSLNLTKQQMGQLKELRKTMKQKKDDITNDQSLTQEQRQDKLNELHKEQKEKLNSILTPGQMEKLKEERKNAKMQKGSMNQADSKGSTIDN